MSVSSGGIDVTAILNPFKMERIDRVVTQGMTVREILECVGADPLLTKFAHVFIGDQYVNSENWHLVRPRAGTKLSIRAFIPPAGGEGGGGKDVLRTVMIIAVAAAAIAFGPVIGGALGLTGALAASVGQAVIGIGGMLLVNALIPPRSTAATSKGGAQTNAEESPTKFIEGSSNRLAPFEPVDVPFGRVRLYPKLAAQPYTELIGDDQYLRLLFNWGIGPLSIDTSTLKIGETLLSAFEGVDVEHFEGYPSDTTPTLFPGVVNQDAFQITLKQVDGYTIRTSGVDADELSVEVVFPEGLITVAEDGTRSNGSVTIQVQYSVAGAGVWNNIPIGDATFTYGWTNGGGGPFNQITFTQKKTAAIRHGFIWRVPVRGQYDVRIARVTADNVLETVRDTIVFTTLRTFTNISPINSPVPVALTALRIKASNQLSGVIDNFSGIVTRVAQHWNGAVWSQTATRNAGDMFRYALQSAALQNPKADIELDLPSIQHFVESCTTLGANFDQNRDFVSTLWDLLQDIAAVGRGSPTLIDGKYGVIIDEAKEPRSLVTPRNSWGFQASKAFITPPHAFRIPFQNEAKDFRTDEVRIYMPGYNAGNATVFESMEHPGIVNADRIAANTLFQIACAIQRPEQWTWQQDMERLAYRRGDVVYLQTDVLLVGLMSGRVLELMTDVDGNYTGIRSDESFIMSTGGNYGVVIRTVADVGLTAQVVTVNGQTNSVTFVNPIPAAANLSANDELLFSFGVLGSETDKALILGYDPSDAENMSATIIAVPYRPSVYSADALIPQFDSKLTTIDPVPAVEIENIRSDETVLTVGAGNSLDVNISVKVRAVEHFDGRLQTQIRPSANNEPFVDAQITGVSSNEVLISDVRTGEYVDLRFRWVVQGRMPGAWSYQSNYRVVGKSTPPAPLTNMTLSVFGGQAFIRWDQPNELDVRFGGSVQFRHSEDGSPSWSNSVSIGNAAQANTLLATLPLKPGTYLARLFDSSGNQSTVETIHTKQASVLQYGLVDQFYESPEFSGATSGVIVDTVGSQKMLFVDSTGDWDGIPDIDAFAELIDGYGGISGTAGVYTFADGFDFGSVKRMRLTTILESFNASIFDLVDSWGNIDDREDFDGADTAVCDCIIYVSLTDDDPNGVSPTWGTWERLDSAEVEARGCRFKAVLTSTNPAYNIYVSTMGVKAEEVI